MKSSFFPECSNTCFVGLQIFKYAQRFNGKDYFFLQISQDSNGMFPVECLNSLSAFLESVSNFPHSIPDFLVLLEYSGIIVNGKHFMYTVEHLKSTTSAYCLVDTLHCHIL